MAALLFWSANLSISVARKLHVPDRMQPASLAAPTPAVETEFPAWEMMVPLIVPPQHIWIPLSALLMLD